MKKLLILLLFLTLCAQSAYADYIPVWPITRGGTGNTSGNAATVTNGIYSTDTGTVTNLMLAGSIANAKLLNPSTTVNGQTCTLGSTCTVTAAANGGNAATVTTNANLTGPISSTGNATSITAQTGTGTTFAMQTSPSFTTPAIDVATGTGLILTGTSANIFAVGTNGSTNPAFNVDSSIASQATGITVQGNAAGSGVAIAATSSGTNEGLTISSKGTGTVTFKAGGTTALSFGSTSSTSSLPFIVNSNNSEALAVGANGATNPALQVDASTASSATGITIKSAAAGSGIAITAVSSGTNEGLSLISKGTGSIQIGSNSTGGTAFMCASTLGYSFGMGGVVRYRINPTDFSWIPTTLGTASTSRFLFTAAADTGLTTAVEAPQIFFNLGATRQHATGAISLQRDFRITGTTHSFVGASTLTTLAAVSIDGYAQAGTNATISNAYGLYIPTQAASGTVTNAYAASFAAPTGGATTNVALNVTDGTHTANIADGTNAITATGNISLSTAGNGIIIKSGSNARIGTGTLTAGTVTIANTSVTANTRVFLQDTTSGGLTNVGVLTAVTTAGTGFVVTSTLALDTSTFNWMLVESQ